MQSIGVIQQILINFIKGRWHKAAIQLIKTKPTSKTFVMQQKY